MHQGQGEMVFTSPEGLFGIGRNGKGNGGSQLSIGCFSSYDAICKDNGAYFEERQQQAICAEVGSLFW